jgi:hypothetical protein
MCENISTTYFEILQTYLLLQTGDSQHNMRQYGHSLFSIFEPGTPNTRSSNTASYTTVYVAHKTRNVLQYIDISNNN